MRTFEDYKKESVTGMIEALKEMPDSEYPVRISVDTEIRSKKHIYDKDNLYAINRQATSAAKVQFREASRETLRELILENDLKLKDTVIKAGTVIPFYGNYLIESPMEITPEQFMIGIALAMDQVISKMEDIEVENNLMDILGTFGEARVIEVLGMVEMFNPTIEKFCNRMRLKNGC